MEQKIGPVEGTGPLLKCFGMGGSADIVSFISGEGGGGWWGSRDDTYKSVIVTLSDLKPPASYSPEESYFIHKLYPVLLNFLKIF